MVSDLVLILRFMIRQKGCGPQGDRREGGVGPFGDHRSFGFDFYFLKTETTAPKVHVGFHLSKPPYKLGKTNVWERF